uniref:Anoctamin n=1 Tax=Bursaphelenchus xylophilus TaxID=6326 RepID=A0A1I7RUH2_BURXY
MRSSLELFQAAAEWIIVLAFFFLNIFLVKETYRALKWRFEKDALNEDFEKVATKLKLCSSFEILIYIVHGPSPTSQTSNSASRRFSSRSKARNASSASRPLKKILYSAHIVETLLVAPAV